MPQHETGEESSGSSALEKLPTKTPHAHDAIIRIHNLDAKMGRLGLLEVIKGGAPPKIYEIMIVDMTGIPEPTTTSTVRDQLAYRTTLEHQRVALKKRENIVIDASNKAYGLLLESCMPNQKSIHDRLVKECDFGTEHHGRYYADGKRAYEIVVDYLLNPSGRTDEDKEFYLTALKLQQPPNKLPNHVDKDVYKKAADAFIDYIVPNLPYNMEVIDQFFHLIALMPECLDSDKRRIKAERLREKTYTDLRGTIEECTDTVYDDRRRDGSAKVNPVFTVAQLPSSVNSQSMLAGLSLCSGLDLPVSMLSSGTGHHVGGAAGKTLQFASMTAGEAVVWCDRCPHGRDGGMRCDADPYYSGPMHAANASNPARKSKIMALRNTNAKGHDDLNNKPKPMSMPTAADLARFKKTTEQRAKWKEGKAKADKGKKESPAAVVAQPQAAAVQTPSLLEFVSSITDLGADTTVPQMLSAGLINSAPNELFHRIDRPLMLSLNHDQMGIALSTAYATRDVAMLQDVLKYNDYSGRLPGVSLLMDKPWDLAAELGLKTSDARVVKAYPLAKGIVMKGAPPCHVRHDILQIKEGDWVAYSTKMQHPSMPKDRTLIMQITDVYDGTTMADGWRRDGIALIPDEVAISAIGYPVKCGDHANMVMQELFSKPLIDKEGTSCVEYRFFKMKLIAVPYHDSSIRCELTGSDFVPDCGGGHTPHSSQRNGHIRPLVTMCAMPEAPVTEAPADAHDELLEDEDYDGEDFESGPCMWVAAESIGGATAVIPYNEESQRDDVNAALLELHQSDPSEGWMPNARVINYYDDKAKAEAHVSPPQPRTGTLVMETPPVQHIEREPTVMLNQSSSAWPSRAGRASVFDRAPMAPTHRASEGRTNYSDVTPRAPTLPGLLDDFPPGTRERQQALLMAAYVPAGSPELRGAQNTPRETTPPPPPPPPTTPFGSRGQMPSNAVGRRGSTRAEPPGQRRVSHAPTQIMGLKTVTKVDTDKYAGHMESADTALELHPTEAQCAADHGAKYDRRRRQWYLPVSVDQASFDAKMSGFQHADTDGDDDERGMPRLIDDDVPEAKKTPTKAAKALTTGKRLSSATVPRPPNQATVPKTAVDASVDSHRTGPEVSVGGGESSTESDPSKSRTETVDRLKTRHAKARTIRIIRNEPNENSKDVTALVTACALMALITATVVLLCTRNTEFWLYTFAATIFGSVYMSENDVKQVVVSFANSFNDVVRTYAGYITLSIIFIALVRSTLGCQHVSTGLLGGVTHGETQWATGFDTIQYHPTPNGSVAATWGDEWQYGLRQIIVVPSIEPPPSPPPSPPTPSLDAPRGDLLTKEQSEQAYLELLGGNEPPKNMPKELRVPCIVDTGCFEDMCPSEDMIQPGTIHEYETKVQGCGGIITLKQKGKPQIPMPTLAHGVCVYRSESCILNPQCPYILIAVGNVSIKQGVRLVLPAWGTDGYFEYPNGMRVPVVNQRVIFVRPIGYKEQPRAALNAVTIDMLGVPPDGDFMIYLGGNVSRPGDLESHLHGYLPCVRVDILEGGATHDLTDVQVITTLIDAASLDRCRNVFSSTRCSSWTAALFMPDKDGNPGKPSRLWPDHVLGIPDEHGKIPHHVEMANLEARAAAEICMAVVATGGTACAETPQKRRDGVDALPDAKQHAYMFDHPAWLAFARSTNAQVVVFDQCRTLDNETLVASTSPKATALLASAELYPAVKANFGNMRCNHAHGAHQALRGAVDGVYRTRGTERYSSHMSSLIADCIKQTLGTSVAAAIIPVMQGVLHGKKLAKGSVDGRHFRTILDHAEHRVLRHVIDAWSDAEPWWIEEIDKIKDEPDDVALRANALEMPHKGITPDVRGLLYIDVWHINVPGIHTGNKTRLVGYYPHTKFFKSVKMKGKYQAPEAIDCMLCFFHSKGHTVCWIHCDCANDLRAGGSAKLCKEKNVRITTNKAYEHQNPVESYNRLAAQGVRRNLTQACMPAVFHESAWDNWEEMRCMRPSKDPPHDCALGRLQGFRPAGAHMRGFGQFCYVGENTRHPGGTLVNKGATQARPCLHFRYAGPISGVGESLTVEKAQPAYICYDPESNSEVYATNVRFVDGCYPGLKRSAGGGWQIPMENVPFSTEALRQKAIKDSHKEPSTTEKDNVVDLTTAGDLEIDPFDLNLLELRKGFPEAERADRVETAESSTRGGATKVQAPKAKPEPEQYMIPAEHWPDYDCSECDGKGWKVTIVGKSKQWRKCKFIKATDGHGRPFTPVWRKLDTLVPLEGDEDTREVPAREVFTREVPVETPIADPVAEPPTITEIKYETEPVPDSRTLPHEEGGDPLKEPARPVRERRAVDRYSPESIVAMYAAASKVGYGDSVGETPKSHLIYEDLNGLGERFYGLAYDKAEITENAIAAGDQALKQFNELTHEHQVALNVLADYDQVAAELGATSPQATTIREVYLLAVVDAAYDGIILPSIDPLLTAIPPPGHADLQLMQDAYNISNQAAAAIMAAAAPVRGTRTAIGDHQPAMVSQDDSFKKHKVSWNEFFNLAELVGVNSMYDDDYDGYMFVSHDVRSDDRPLNVPSDKSQSSNRRTYTDNTCADLAFVAKARTSPDIFGERQMRGPDWDEPKQIEINMLTRLGAIKKMAADDPAIKHLRLVDTMWTGRCKRLADGSVSKLKGRCVLRGDLHGKWYEKTANDAHAPVVMNTSSQAADAISCLYQRHRRPFDAPSAYLQGIQKEHEQTLARPPHDFREWDERGVEIVWLLMHPLYGQTDAGAIWNRTFNEFATRNNNTRTEGTSEDLAASITIAQAAVEKPTDVQEPVDRTNVPGMSYHRCPHDPCVYARELECGGHVGMTLYVDDGQNYYDDTPTARAAGEADCKLLSDRFNIKFGEPDPVDDYFLGANRIMSKDRSVVMINAESYIRAMVERYCDGDVSNSKQFPAHWSHVPADEELVRAHEAAVQNRTPASPKLFTDFNSLVGSLRHVVKYRPEISAAMDLLGCCLTFPTLELLRLAYRVLVYLGRNRRLGCCYSKHAPNAGKLFARADSNWREVRSTSGFCIFLGGSVISHRCIRQKCISMSSTEAELVALAECAIELLHVIGLVRFLGLKIDGPVEVETDNKGAFDLCHRYSSAQNSRHIDRKMFKMREMRGAGIVTVKYVPTDDNTADLWTKILKNRQTFEKHRNVALNKSAGDGLLAGRTTAASGESAA